MAQHAPLDFLGQHQVARLWIGHDFVRVQLSPARSRQNLVRRAKQKSAYLCYRENQIEMHCAHRL